MNPSKLFTLIACLIGCWLVACPANAQEMLRRGKTKTRVMQYTQGRNDFILDQADLDQNESLFVTEALAKYDSKRHRIWSQNYKLLQKIRQMQEVSEEDYRKALKEHIRTLKEIAECNEDLIEELLTKLSYEKAYKVVMSEKRYNKEMFDIHEKHK